MASWTGITAATAYSPILLSKAGYNSLIQNGLAGRLNTIGIVGTIISAHIFNRLRRHTCLIDSSFSLFAINLIAGALYKASRGQSEKSLQFAPAAVCILFLFNLLYASTWGTVAFLTPTEIWPSDMLAQGNWFGITGQAIGVGMTVLVNPMMFKVLEKSHVLPVCGLEFALDTNVYPETAKRSLESIEALFSTKSPFNWNMDKAYAKRDQKLVEQGLSTVLENDHETK